MISSVIQKIIRFDIPVYDIELVHSSQGREQRSHIIFSLTYSHVVHVILHVQTKSFDVHNNISILMYISLASFHIIIIIFRATSYLTVGDETSFQIVIKYTLHVSFFSLAFVLTANLSCLIKGITKTTDPALRKHRSSPAM